MMKDMSMHILDIAQNSIVANAKNITIEIDEDCENNIFSFSIADDGKGMSEEMLKVVQDPFTTTRTTRKVGLGIPLLAQTCRQCGGDIELTSTVGVGTTIKAKMNYNDIDRPPLGDIVNSLVILIVTNAQVCIKYIHRYNGKEYVLDMREVVEMLDGVPLDEPEVMGWLKDNLNEGIREIKE